MCGDIQRSDTSGQSARIAETSFKQKTAAKIDVTPADLAGFTNLWGAQFGGIHDRIYVRAPVLDNCGKTAALVVADVVELGDTTAVRQRIAVESGIHTLYSVLMPDGEVQFTMVVN